MRGCVFFLVTLVLFVVCVVAEVMGSYYLADTHPVVSAGLALSALLGVIATGVRLLQEVDK